MARHEVENLLSALCSSRLGFLPALWIAYLSRTAPDDRSLLRVGPDFEALSIVRTQYPIYEELFSRYARTIEFLALHSSPYIRAYGRGLITRHHARTGVTESES